MQDVHRVPEQDLGLEVAVTHDVGRVIAGDWTGDVKMWNAADGLLVGPLAANPPTLEMTAQAATAREFLRG